MRVHHRIARRLLAWSVVSLAACGDAPADPADEGVTPSPPSDITPPQWRRPVIDVTARGMTHVAIAWTPASDESGLVRYRVEVLGRVSEVTAPRTTLTGLPRRGAHEVVVRAFDAAGNEAPERASARVETLDGCALSLPALPRVVGR